MSEPMCNGAGEMPGQEGRDSISEDYNEWVNSNENEILEAYKEKICIDDVPEDFISNMYENAEE